VLVTFVVRRYDRETMSALANEILASVEGVKGVVLNQNESPDNTVLGDTFLCLAGSASIRENIGGLAFKVSPASFFQVNPFQAEVLYRKAIEFSETTPQDVVLDAYCGVGTLALLAAGQSKKVIGVECVAEAIEDAKENAALNGIQNAEFICDTTENSLKGIEKADIVFLNPPRKGCEAEAIAALAKIRPKTIVYVSCDPETLARDLSLLSSAGYRAEAVQPLDMFPQTAHVETVVKLSLSSFSVGGDPDNLVQRMDHKEP
jgi:23S rRNA (uracil1939-C5)-methyltransferase